jgi:hypothetical protein
MKITGWEDRLGNFNYDRAASIEAAAEVIAAHRESAVAQACAERDADNAMWKTKQECAIAQIELSNQAVASLEAKLTAKDAEIRRLKELADSAVRAIDAARATK